MTSVLTPSNMNVGYWVWSRRQRLAADINVFHCTVTRALLGFGLTPSYINVGYCFVYVSDECRSLSL